MLFSVITPVYNREDCISRCIESVLRQSLLTNPSGGGKIEHVIVDDGSTDLTAKICEGYVKGNGIIKFMKMPHNVGTNAARNAAIKAASGDWIVILDSDDYFVDDALEYMSQIIEAHPEYKHFMFAPDDVSYADSFFNNCLSKVLTYEDFLKGVVKTGFIHCIAADTMRKHPFDEAVRIHEGVFFLSFYKEASKMLFTNHIVTIRERGRADSVTLDCVRSNRTLIERATKANEMMLERFGGDFVAFGCHAMLRHVYGYLYDNYLLLGQYGKIQQLDDTFNKHYAAFKPHDRKMQVLRIMRTLHIGGCYWLLLKSYLFVKYKLFKYKIK